MILTRDESVEQNASNITRISVRSTFLMKNFKKEKIGFCSFIFEFRELRLVQTCKNISEPNYRILFGVIGDNSTRLQAVPPPGRKKSMKKKKLRQALHPKSSRLRAKTSFSFFSSVFPF